MTHGSMPDGQGDPRPFRQEDLKHLKKKELYDLVISKPLPATIRVGSKTNKSTLVALLLEPSLGYYNLHPPPQLPEDGGKEVRAQRDSSAARLSAELEDLDSGGLESLNRGEPPLDHGDSVDVADVKNIIVYIEDRRFQRDFRAKICQQITVPFKPYNDGDYQVRIRDVLSQLQDSPAAIIAGSDPVAIGTPDHLHDASYTRCLAVGVVDSLLNTLGDSEVIDMPGDVDLGFMELRVEEANPTAKRARELEDKDEALKEVKKSKSTKTADADSEDSENKDGPIELLRSKLVKRPGYTTFKAASHKTLQNPDIAGNWEFAAKFSRDFHGRSVNPNLHVTKAMIHAALGSGETWLVEAEKGHQLVKKYGEGGEREAEEVVREISTKRDSPTGSKKLLKFLKDWDIEHGERLS